MGGCLFMLAVIFFVIGVIQLLAPDRSRPAAGSQRGWENIFSPGAFSTPPAPPPAARESYPAPAAAPGGGKTMTHQKLDWIQVGQRIYVQHPVRGELMAHVLGRIRYAELWQTHRGSQNPWVPTGNAFYGFWLEGSLFLLNWQSRCYLLDEAVDLTDAEIQQNFAAHARQFAQSDQKADVYFAYPPAMWHIDDIGKFRVEAVEGEGARFSPGAIGRFIHSSGDSGRALVVEDYESGGAGQDTAWIGYQIQETGIRPE